jgi:hypothetical protein
MNTKIHIKLGFKLDDIFFGWHEGVLYQLPYYSIDGKYVGLRTVKQKKLKKNGWVYYHIRRKKVGIEKLRAMLQSVTWEVSKPIQLNKTINNEQSTK